MKVTINGEPKNFEAPLNVFDMLAQEGVVEMMIAVARNGDVVPKENYATTELTEGDLIEIVSPQEGG